MLRGTGLAAAALLGAAASPALATTLREALIGTYASNPTLTAQRAGLRATDETVGIARAASRPQASANASVAQNYEKIDSFHATGRQLATGANLAMPIYQGGRVRNAIHAAEARVGAGRADLRTTEGDVFTDAVGAYMDVVRDLSIVELNRNNVRVLETNLQATQDRFQVGDVTRTDVAQSQARLSGAQSQLSSAESQLTSSDENYLRIIGAVPAKLDPPPPLPVLPDTADRAASVALENNPQLLSIAAQVKAARYDVDTARGARLPTLSAFGNGAYNKALGKEQAALGLYDDQLSASGGLQLSIPLYQGGLVGAQVRQAQALQSQVMEQGVAVERQVIASARATFAAYQASLDVVRSSEEAVSANTLALEGVRAENSVGTRTVLDVLNAEQELLNSQVTLVSARRDAYVAGFQLLNAMGQAEMRDLGLDGGPLYDPAVNYNRVSRRISDFGDDPAPATQASRTVPEATSTPPAPAIGPPAPDSGVTAPGS